MSKIDPDIVKLYVLALKHGMKLKDVPRAWLNVEQAASIDSDYPLTKVPGYVKMIIKYGTEKG